MHQDDSEVTVNVCVGLEDAAAGGGAADGGGGGDDERIAVCGRYGEPRHRAHVLDYAHETGRALVHLGAQRHGARPLARGRARARRNVVLWARSSSLRASRAWAAARAADRNADDGAPDARCLSYTLDADYLEHAAAYPPGASGTFAERRRVARLVETVGALSAAEVDGIDDAALRGEVRFLRALFASFGDAGQGGGGVSTLEL